MKSWFSIRNKSAEKAEIDIFDEIGFWGVTAKAFVTELRAKTGGVKEVVVNLNTPGGDCSEGFTIYDALQALRTAGVTVTMNITGLAASMGSVIMLAADKIRIAENGRVMIHRVTGGGYGNADELDAVAEVVKQFEDRIVGLYVARTKKTEEEVRDMMKTPIGTWFFGEEAVAAGFADEVISGVKAQAFQSRWAEKFAMLPAALFDMREKPEHANPADTSMKKILLALASALSIKIENDATEEQIAAAFAAFKPAPVTAELNLEDAETKQRFDTAVSASVTAAIKPLTDRLDKAEKDLATAQAEVTRLTSLNGNGALGAGQGAPPISGAGKDGGKKELTRAEFDALTPRAKAEFFRNGGKLTD